jgi:hypothetical protein
VWASCYLVCSTSQPLVLASIGGLAYVCGCAWVKWIDLKWTCLTDVLEAIEELVAAARVAASPQAFACGGVADRGAASPRAFARGGVIVVLGP